MNFRVLIVFTAIAVSVAMQAQSSQRAALAARQPAKRARGGDSPGTELKVWLG